MPSANDTWIRLKCGYCGNIERQIPIHYLFSADADKQQIQCPECKAYLLNRREPFRSFSDDADTRSLRAAQEAYADHDFESACEAYSQLMVHPAHRNDPEVYWQYLMCYYGIVWIEDEANGDVKPIIFHPRSGNEASIADHPQYDRLISLAQTENVQEGTLNYYRSNARRIKDIQLGFERLQTDYDVFLCCKKYIPGTQFLAPEREAANSLRKYLEGRGIRVFIDDLIPTGANYEAYILAALRDSRLMFVFSSCREYLHSPWVQNEWERFLWLKSQSESPTTVRAGRRYIAPVACNDMQFEDFEQGIDRLQGVRYTPNIDWSQSVSLRNTLNMIWPESAQNPPPPAPGKKRTPLKVLSVIAVIALAAGGGWMASSRTAPEKSVTAQAPAPTAILTAAPTAAPTEAPAPGKPEIILYADGAPVSDKVHAVSGDSLTFSWTASGELQRCDLMFWDSAGNIYSLPSQTRSTRYELAHDLLNTLKPGETYTFELTAVPAGENVTEKDFGKAQAQFTIPSAPAEIIGDSEIGTLGLSPAIDGEYPRLRTTALSGGAKAPVWSSTGNGSVITELEKDTVIKYLNHSILNKDGKIWMYVQCSQNQQGWISSENVEPIDEGGAELHVSQPDSESCCHLPLFSGEIYHPAVITGGSIPLRSGPGAEHDIYAFISKGDAPLWLGLSAFDEQENVWYFVCCDDMQTGWVSSELCEITYDPQSLPSELLQ